MYYTYLIDFDTNLLDTTHCLESCSVIISLSHAVYYELFMKWKAVIMQISLIT